MGWSGAKDSGGIPARLDKSPTAPPAVPDHELLHPIGRGSYGEVWLARNILGTFRAVKIIRRDSFANPRPFEREFAGIHLMEPLSRGHEGLVDILQVGRAESDEYFYYVMELADPVTNGGETTGTTPGAPYHPRSLGSDLASRGRLSVAECIDLFHGLALALGHLHRARLVHRDIKPSNIIFVGGVAKLADIGLVAAAAEGGSYVGTEGYIPPEGAGTFGADIYSLGKVLYEAGTGKDRAHFPALPADAADLAASVGLMELNAVWLKACATAPADRYRNTDELAADLALLRAGRSVKRLRLVESRLGQARRFAVGLAALAVVIAIGWWVAERQTESERAARLIAAGLQRRAMQAEGVAKTRLSETRLAQIRAVLQSQQMGRRAVALDLLTNEISPRDRVAARSLAATALALPDLVPLGAMATVTPPSSPAAQPQPDGSILTREPGGTPRTIPPQRERVREILELAGSGRFLYAGYEPNIERIWDLTDGREVARLDTNYFHLDFRPGQAEVAVAYGNGEVILHRLPGWETNRIWPKTAGEVIHWNADGSRLLVIGSDRRVRLLDPQTGGVKALGEIKSSVNRAIWHPDGRHLAILTGEGYMRVQDIESWPEYAVLTRHESQIVAAAFLPPFPWLVTSSWDGTSKLWDWQAGQELGRLEATGYDLAFDATNRILHWRLGAEAPPSAWRVMGGEVWRQFFQGDPLAPGGPFMAGFSGDSQWVVTPDDDGVRVWHIASGTVALFLPGAAQAVWLNAAGTELLVNNRSAIRRWRLTPGANQKLAAVEGERLAPPGGGEKLAVSADGAVIGWLAGPEVRLCDHGTRKSWSHGQESAEMISVSPDGRLVAVGTRNRTGARIFDTAAGRLLWQTDIGKGTHPSFSADSQWLALGTDHGCHVFAAATGKLRWSRAPESEGETVFWETAFSPDGAFLAWTPKTWQVQIVNATDGSEVLTLDYPTRRFITGLAFSPDGRWLAETSSKHVLHLWDMQELRRQLEDLGLGW